MFLSLGSKLNNMHTKSKFWTFGTRVVFFFDGSRVQNLNSSGKTTSDSNFFRTLVRDKFNEQFILENKFSYTNSSLSALSTMSSVHSTTLHTTPHFDSLQQDTTRNSQKKLTRTQSLNEMRVLLIFDQKNESLVCVLHATKKMTRCFSMNVYVLKPSRSNVVRPTQEVL